MLPNNRTATGLGEQVGHAGKTVSLPKAGEDLFRKPCVLVCVTAMPRELYNGSTHRNRPNIQLGKMMGNTRGETRFELPILRRGRALVPETHFKTGQVHVRLLTIIFTFHIPPPPLHTTFSPSGFQAEHSYHSTPLHTTQQAICVCR